MMICKNCNTELPDGAAFCPNCGTAVTPDEPAFQPIPDEPASQPTPDEFASQPAPGEPAVQPMSTAARYKTYFSDPMYLIMCILVTAGAFFTLVDGGLLNAALVLPVLFAVFMWLVFFEIKNGELKENYLRCISGTAFASVVLNWIAVGAFALLGILFLAAGSLFGSLLYKILDEVDAFDTLQRFSGSLLLQSLGAVVGLILLIIAVCLALINCFGYRPIHQFAKSLYIGVQTNTDQPQNPQTAQTWLLVLGIFSGIGALGNATDGLAFLSNGCIAAAYVVASLWIKKYFRR